jgi:predicted lipid-binding transport protein (Tim44 family)
MSPVQGSSPSDEDTTMMKKWLGLLAVAVGVSFTLAPFDADAKRLGGGKSQGMQRTAPDKPAQNTATPPTQAAPNAAPGAPAAAAAPAAAGTAAAAAASKRSWLGPIAGLAAGLGLVALFSAMGLGEELANFVMLALMLVAAFFLIRFLISRFAGNAASARMAPAAAGAGANTRRQAPPVFVDERPGMQRSAQPVSAAPSVVIGSALQPAATAGPSLPADFDAEGFERLAKMLFIRIQAANDTADLNDLRQFTTPELFAALRLDLQDRGDATQHTDVVKVDAQLIDFEQESDRQVVSVRYTGLVREEAGADATPFDEVWHLVKPADDSRPWAIAGIQQQAQPTT